MPEPRTRQAIALMEDFAGRTGLTSDNPPRRYLWTDAFAVCNFLGLARTTGDAHFTALALRLIDQVHHTLGRQRPDHGTGGWLSGLSEQEGEAHPTRGGLRIGKQSPERGTGEAFDDQLEWERDGQYFHYLTKWMHALDQAARATGQAAFNLWARELAETAYAAFSYAPSGVGGARRMYWKMSIDLSRAQVPSMGQHDPLDGYITCLQLHATAAGLTAATDGPALSDETAGYAAMLKRGEWATADPLGIGGLLVDAYRVQQLMRAGELADDRLLVKLLTAAREGLAYFSGGGELSGSAERRLAFRELGLAIGLRATRCMWEAARLHSDSAPAGSVALPLLEELTAYAPLAERIESFWRTPDNQAAWTWLEHRDINEVMLATSLAPEGFLGLW
jgi:hypothetical protein